MNIIIVGCGKVGTALASQLSQEENNVCVIDQNRSRLEHCTSTNDVMGVCGNGSNYTVLQHAGISDASLLVAVTGSDELNLLCCVIAQKTATCETIARVRNPVYEKESVFLKEELGLSMIINPELLTAQEIFDVLAFPTALDVSRFPQSQVEMIRYRIPQNSPFANKQISEVADRISPDVLIGSIERGGEVSIANGNSVLHAGDIISLLATRKTLNRLFHSSKNPHTVKNVLIIGGGKISVYLSRMLLKTGIEVNIIESDLDRCEELSDTLPDAAIIHGDGSDKELLREERIDSMDAFVALTNFDEENILLSLFARKLVHKKVVTKINRFQLNEVIYNLDLDSVIYPKNLTTERILQYVRAHQNSIGSNISTLYRFVDNQVEVLEFTIKENSPLTRTTLAELDLKSNLIIGCIIRKGKSILPKGQDQILPGDSIIVVTSQLGLRDAKDILRGQGDLL